MKILIVSGFLGAGKTTFIREMRNRTGKEFVVYENEYADTGVDTKLLETDEISVWESTEKCVCCSGKQDFASSILTISNTLDPEYLIVEPTGIAKLGNVLSNIQMVQYEKIEVLAPVTLVDATNYFKQKAKYEEILNNQIEFGSKVVITKPELCPKEELDIIKNEIKTINGEDPVVGWYKCSKEWWEDLLLHYSDGRTVNPETLKHAKHPESFAVQNVSLPTANYLLVFLELVVRGAFGNIDRAKGLIKCGDAMLRFDSVGSLWSVTGFDETNEDTVCVILGEKIDRNRLREFLVYKPENVSAHHEHHH